MTAEKVILITGASSGLGLATATLLAQRGYCVFGTSRKPDRARKYNFTMLSLDVQQAGSVRACVAAVLAQAGRIDVLVNNAGYVGPAAASEELSLEQIKHLFDTNFFGVIQMTNAVLPVMRAQGGGQIINISSAAGFLAGPPFFSIYAASKHALEGYSEALRYELGAFNIRVAIIEPGYFKTNIDQTIQPPDHPLPEYAARRAHVSALEEQAVQRGRDPKQVARLVQRIIESERRRLRYPVASDAVMMSMLKRLLPFGWVERVMVWVFLEGDSSQKMTGFHLRRYMLDGRFQARTQRGVLVGGALLGMMGLWRWLRRRF